MTVINQLADFVRQVEFDALPGGTRSDVKVHTLDTVGAMLAGPQTSEGKAIGKLVSAIGARGDVPVIGYPMKAALSSAILAEVSATRCTEMDDYHRCSVVTCGSVAVTTALSWATCGYFRDPKEFMTAVAVGYEMALRLGIATDGPNLLPKGVWPTYLAAAFGSATVTAKALRLSTEQTANALATALAMSGGTKTPEQKGISSRCISLGVAAQAGLVAAFSAQEGFLGDMAVLEKNFGQSHGVSVAEDKLVSGLGQQFEIEQTGLKPFPIAGPALSAVEAFRNLIKANSLSPEAIQDVSVLVPKAQAHMIDQPAFPKSWIYSILSVQYLIALAALCPDALFDVVREPIVWNERIRGMMQKVHVKPCDELERYVPEAAPARVEVQTKNQTYTAEVIHPKGHQSNKFTWQEIVDKFERVTISILGDKKADRTAHLIQELHSGADMADLLALLTEQPV